jgi:hypothetical protein
VSFDGRGFTCKRVMEEAQPILHVVHDAGGDWQFLCGGDEHGDETVCLLIHPSHLVDRDPSLVALSGLQRGFAAIRRSIGGDWTVSPCPVDRHDDEAPDQQSAPDDEPAADELPTEERL